MKKGFLILIFTAIYCNSFGIIQHEIDSIKRIIKTEKTDSVLMNCYLTLSSKYLQENNDSSLAYAQKALHLAENNLNDKAIALCRIGLIYFNLGDLPNALSHYNQSLIIAKATNYDLYIAQNYKLIGALYGYDKDYKNALSYQYKALAIYDTKKDTINIARTYDNVAVYYRRLAIYDSSMHYLNLAIDINNRLNNYRSLSFNYNNMASLYLAEKDYDRAEEYYLKSLTLREQYGLKQDLLQSHNNLGNLFYNTKKYHKAIPYFNSCIQIAKQIKIIKHLHLFYDNLSATYYELGNYELALLHRKNQYRYGDSINSSKTQLFIANQENEIKKLEEEYYQAQLKTEVESAEKLILKKSILVFILIFTGLIALYIVIYSAKHYKLRESVIQHESSLQAIQGAEKVLSEKEAAAQKINAAQEVLTAEIATLLNTEVTLKLTKILKQLNNYKLNHPEAATVITKEQTHITDAIQFINNISSNLLPPILDTLLLTEVINKYIDTVFSSLDSQVNLTFSNPDVINAMEKDLSHNIYRIIQELITNSIKYSKATIIDIEISNSNDHLLLRVHDNGIGFNANENNTGLGLSNVKHRAQLYNGNVIINTKKGEGTEILINMNYKKA